MIFHIISFIFLWFCYYLFNYLLFNEFYQPFVYQVMKNVQETHDKPLYDIDSMRYKKNQTEGLKYNLAMKQGWRCMQCQNPILTKDLSKHTINYMKPLEFGGRIILKI